MTALHIPRRVSSCNVWVNTRGQFHVAVDMGTEWPECQVRQREWMVAREGVSQMVAEILDCNFPAVIETPLICQIDDACDWYLNAVIRPRQWRQTRERILGGLLVATAAAVLLAGLLAR